ncbi:integral membrane protein [Streptomyces cyaneogriseus subsp. noncyanogenus]|uniref:Integral membrane protein n=1 Tax=Streptomyces cyaneogriseus subsp. noncyanogenus TaxID=477245 RepID=A0A0C5FQR2_9ACTN|nr:hypothetical protein [Streptomyces cyaneogriseus]AJP02362.1 integral membrane protein [Streptomyces cyaneogriseus subsp. noncyanogenus]
MHGHGYTQPVKQPPPTGWLVFLRVLFVTLSLLSLGFLTWTMLLRLAIVTRKALDWGLFVAVLAVDIVSIVLLGSEPGEEIHTAGGWTGLGLLLGTLVVVIAYYLSADVRHFHQLRYGAYVPHPAPAAAYGYPQPPGPYLAAPPAPMPGPPISAPAPHAPVPPPPPAPAPAATHTPVPAPPPRPPAPARIDQVRAELDELSDYLRRQGGGHEGGR